MPSENDGLTEATAAGVAAETDNKLKVPAFGGDLAYNGSLSFPAPCRNCGAAPGVPRLIPVLVPGLKIVL